MLVLRSMQIVFEFCKDVLGLLYPFLGHGSLTISKKNFKKSKGIIIVQRFQRRHTNGQVVSGVVAIIPQIKPFEPCFLLPYYIILEVTLHPFVHYFCFPICLRMVASARSQLSTHQSKQFQPKDAHKLVSLSLTIFLGSPCNLKTSTKNNLVT
jgi:hypothetical protein